MIKAIIFDMDGVLVDAKEWHYLALNKALQHFGYNPISHNDHVDTFDGLPTSEKLKKHQQTKNLSTDEHDKINQLKQEFTNTIIQDSCHENPGHMATMADLKKKGYQLAVCSNAVRESVRTMLENSNLIQFMNFFLSNQDVHQAKPHPEIYQKALNMLGIQPEEALICEDNIRGIESALASGAYVLEIGTIEDVNLDNINHALTRIEHNPNEKLIRAPVRTARLSDMKLGWFVGDFYPNILRTSNFEVAVKHYKAGDSEAWHVHKVGTEITLILDGQARMAGRLLKDGDMICLEPGNGTSFEALTDLKTVVVKTPSALGDKYTQADLDAMTNKDTHEVL